jgi:hypothetical protein
LNIAKRGFDIDITDFNENENDAINVGTMIFGRVPVVLIH